MWILLAAALPIGGRHHILPPRTPSTRRAWSRQALAERRLRDSLPDPRGLRGVEVEVLPNAFFFSPTIAPELEAVLIQNLRVSRECKVEERLRLPLLQRPAGAVAHLLAPIL
jgi:hypothetical protein